MSYLDKYFEEFTRSSEQDDFFESDDLDLDKEMDNAMKEFDEGDDLDLDFDDDDDEDDFGEGYGCEGGYGCNEGSDEDDDDDELDLDLDDDDDDDEDDDDDLDLDNDGEVEDDELDEELGDLEREVGVNGSLSSEGDSFIPTSVLDDTPAPPLDEVEDEEADRSMAVLATPAVIDDTLTVDDVEKFVESGEAEIAISEGLMEESTLMDIVNDANSDSFMEAKFAAANQKYKMTKKARFNQLYELSLQIEARHHKDPYYAKLQKAYKIERTIKKGFRKRYHSLAVKRAKKYLKKLMLSKSPTLRKAAKSFTPGR